MAEEEVEVEEIVVIETVVVKKEVVDIQEKKPLVEEAVEIPASKVEDVSSEPEAAIVEAANNDDPVPEEMPLEATQ